MGHQDGGDPGVCQQPRDQFAHGRAQAGVECGKRLIEQHQARLLRQCPRQSHTLLLAAGKLVGPTIGHAGIQCDAVHQFSNSLLFLRTLDRQAETDVGGDGHVREQGAVLRDITYLALVRRDFVGVVHQRLAVECQATPVRKLETGDHAQQGGFARTGRPDDHRAAARRHRQADVFQGALRAIGFADRMQFKSVHRPAVFLDW